MASAGLSEEDAAAGLQDAMDLRERQRTIRDVMKSVETHGLVHRLRGERQCLQVADNDTSVGSQSRLPNAQHVERDVDAHRLDVETPEPLGHPATSGAEIQHMLAWFGLEAQQSHREVVDQSRPFLDVVVARRRERLDVLPSLSAGALEIRLFGMLGVGGHRAQVYNRCGSTMRLRSRAAILVAVLMAAWIGLTADDRSTSWLSACAC